MKIGSSQNYVRHVGGSHIDNGVINGSAFERTAKDVDGVSISLRGVFSTSTKSDVSRIREVVGARRNLGRSSVFAELNAGTTLSVLQSFEEQVSIVSAPLECEGELPADPAHALIVGLPFKGETVGSLRSEVAGDLLARRIICTYPAVV